LAIREVRRQMYIGVRESEARAMLARALAAQGLEGGGLVLFGGAYRLPPSLEAASDCGRLTECRFDSRLSV
jgi:hypothetical protein